MRSEAVFGIEVYDDVWLPTCRGKASGARGKALGSTLKAAPPAGVVVLVVLAPAVVMPLPWVVAVDVFQFCGAGPDAVCDIGGPLLAIGVRCGVF